MLSFIQVATKASDWLKIGNFEQFYSEQLEWMKRNCNKKKSLSGPFQNCVH
jgi:hypothetical protein